MSDLIDRQMALAFPLANDVYDHQRANKDFIAGCESYREWIARLPSAEPHSIKLNQGQSSDMISRQQAIDALRKMQTYKLFSGDDMLLIDQAGAMTELMLLPSAEPHTFRVIDTKTKKEADTYEIALKEEWAKGLCYCDMEGFAIEEDGTLMLLDECGKCAYCPQGRFEVIWDG